MSHDACNPEAPARDLSAAHQQRLTAQSGQVGFHKLMEANNAAGGWRNSGQLRLLQPDVTDVRAALSPNQTSGAGVCVQRCQATVESAGRNACMFFRTEGRLEAAKLLKWPHVGYVSFCYTSDSQTMAETAGRLLQPPPDSHGSSWRGQLQPQFGRAGAPQRSAHIQPSSALVKLLHTHTRR